MSVVSTDEDVLRRFRQIVRCGNITSRPRNDAQPHWKPQWTWRISGKSALILADRIRPYLCSRRTDRLNEIVAFISDSQPKAKRCEWCNSEFTPERFARQRFCTDKCLYRAKYMRRKYKITSKAEADERGILGQVRPEFRTVCPQGHDLKGQNVYHYTRPDGRKERRCRACGRERWHKRKKAGVIHGTAPGT